MHLEIYADKVCVFINVPISCNTEHLPICCFKAVLESTNGFSTPALNCPKKRCFPVLGVSVGRDEHNGGVIRLPKSGAGEGFVAVPYLRIAVCITGALVWGGVGVVAA